MQVQVLFFGTLADLAGRRSQTVELPERSTLADLLNVCSGDFPELKNFSNSLALSVNQEYASPSAMLRDNDEVALLPPVSGGATVARVGEEAYVRLVHERIVPHEIVPPQERPEDGAIVIFDGIVRNHSRGRRTLYLEYEAYEPMALAEMRKLAEQAKEKFTIRQTLVVHRLGRLEIGESSVLIAVYGPHRAAAFDACRWLIDTLKQTVPIWKKEFFEDGAVWAPGEPFPADQRR
jgi:molybdopterin synthase catalytic subunit